MIIVLFKICFIEIKILKYSDHFLLTTEHDISVLLRKPRKRKTSYNFLKKVKIVFNPKIFIFVKSFLLCIINIYIYIYISISFSFF